MKKKILLTSVMSVLALGMSVSAEPNEMRDPPVRPMMRGPERPDAPRQMRPGMMMERMLNHPEMRERLGLSDDQLASLKALRLDTEKKMIRLRGDVELANLDLRAAMSGKSPDRAAVMSAIDKLHEAQAEIQKTEIGARLDAQEVLGPEVTARIETLTRDRMQQMRNSGDGWNPERLERRGEHDPFQRDRDAPAPGRRPASP